MNIAFYVDEMNLRGVANSTYQFAYQNKKTLKNKSIIFYNKRNYRNKNNVIKKFKSKFRVIGISEFKEIDNNPVNQSISPRSNILARFATGFAFILRKLNMFRILTSLHKYAK